MTTERYIWTRYTCNLDHHLLRSSPTNPNYAVIHPRRKRLCSMDSSYTLPTTKPLFHASQFVWYILLLTEGMLFLRLFLKLFGANPSALFTDTIYTLTNPLVAPFVAVFNTTRLENNIFEWTTLLAAVVFFMLALAITKLLVMSKTVSSVEAARRLSNEA